MERMELLDQIETVWLDWQGLLSRLTPADMVQPELPGGWSVKDAIAHIAFCEEWVGTFIATRAWPPAKHPSLDTTDMDAQNDAYFALNKDLALDDVLEESHRVHQHLVDTITALTDEQYHDRDLLGAPPDEQWELKKLIDGNTFKHYPDHAEATRDWLASRE